MTFDIDAGTAFVLGVALATVVWVGVAVLSCKPVREQPERRVAGGRRKTDRALDETDEHEEITHG